MISEKDLIKMNCEDYYKNTRGKNLRVKYNDKVSMKIRLLPKVNKMSGVYTITIDCYFGTDDEYSVLKWVSEGVKETLVSELLNACFKELEELYV